MKKAISILTILFLLLLCQPLMLQGCKNKKQVTEKKVETAAPTQASRKDSSTETSKDKPTQQMRDSTGATKGNLSRKVATVDVDKCIGCGVCVGVCPNNAIKISGGKAVVDPEKCRAVGNCKRICPVEAISIK